jgi:hypothetical protein
MPITDAEVLKVLSDPALNTMFFSVGSITVSAREYGNVLEYVRDGDIKVTPGREPVAFYDGRNNTIITQAGDPPLNLSDRSQLLHECTHAIVDVNELDVERLDDEVAAYLAQVTYMVISKPTPFPSPVHPPHHGSPFGELVWSLLQVINKYSLHTAKGFGVRIRELDVWNLRAGVRALPDYARIGEHEKSVGGGVPIKNNQMRSLKAALRRGERGRQHPKAYSPSPRIPIF